MSSTAFALVGFAALVGAQQTQSAQKDSVLQAVRTERAPVIDGVLEPRAWDDAARISKLTQVEPFEGQDAEASTQVLLLYDSHKLYLAFRCEEPNPEEMSLRQMRRDGAMRGDDRVEWILAPYPQSQRGFWFQLTAAGARGDALVAINGFKVDKAWDGLWTAKTVIHKTGGWTAEVEIPFSSLQFEPGQNWGFNVERFRASGRTTDRWSVPLRSRRLTTIGIAGTLSGLDSIEKQDDFEFKPYVKGSFSNDAVANDRDLIGDFGADLNMSLGPGLRAGFTVNTDFAQTEVDDLQVNLSRFRLFFPEKRDFFLEGSQHFDFGPIRIPSRNQPDLLAFHSRTIGLFAGQEVPIEGGVRIAGNEGPFGIGLIAARTDARTVEVGGIPVTVPESDLLVMRPTYSIPGAGIQVGGFLAAGDPSSGSAAQTAGVDFRFLRPNLEIGNVGVNAYWMRSFDGVTNTRDVAYGIQTNLQTADWTVQYALQNVGANFRAALGFVRRSAYHKHRLILAYEPRTDIGGGSAIKKYLFKFDPTVYLDLSNDLETYRLPLQVFGVEWHSGDSVTFALVPEGDRPGVAFAPVPGSLVPAGDHDWFQAEVVAQSSPFRPLAGTLIVNAGSWYDGGTIEQFQVQGDWRPSQHLRLGLAYQQSHAEIPGGDFTTRVEQLIVDWLFSPDLYWQNLVQSDNVSRTLGVQSRLRWIQEDSREFFLVLESGWQDNFRALVPTRTDLTFKAVWALRF